MTLLDNRTRAMVWAQWRGILNFYRMRGESVNWVMWIFSAIWYGLVLVVAGFIAVVLPEVRTVTLLRQVVGGGCALAMLYWQLIPVLLVSSGMSLHLKKVTVYPVPEARLFAIEVFLRITTGAEVLIVLAGAAAGLWRHPLVPWYAPLALLPFALMNMTLSAGLRDLLSRLLSRRGIRELVVLGFVLITALPQILLAVVPEAQWKALEDRFTSGRFPGIPWPWSATAALSTGSGTPWDSLLALLWLALFTWFGFSQFRRNLRWDSDEVRATSTKPVLPMTAGLREKLLRLPSAILPDPLGALVEKEIRFLSRAPRFRLVFFMGFTFGLMIWLPVVLGRDRQTGFFSENFLVWVSLYAALLLGEVLFWNHFGFDRQAVQAYYALPVPFARVVIAKNIAAVVLLLLEISLVAAAVWALRLPVTGRKLLESYSLTLMFCLFLLAAGNLASIYHPRPIDPAQSWRNNSSGRVQAYLILIYPLLAFPVALAYLARYAFETEWAFYGVVACSSLVALLTYWVALDSVIAASMRERERIVETLSRGQSVIG
jgi:ABC-2 type transport system permease protein